MGNAALSGICAFPLLGDFLGKAGKETKYLLKLTDLSKLKRNEKVLDMLKDLDIFIKARRADISELHRWIRKSWDNLLGGGGYAAEYVTQDGMIYRIRTSDDFWVNINLMDDAGDMLQAGRKVGNAGGLAVKGGTYTNIDAELNFSNKVLEHMRESGRRVPIQTLQDAIRHSEALPDPRSSSATMYNLEVLYDNVTNTVYHFEYARKAMGNLQVISK